MEWAVLRLFLTTRVRCSKNETDTFNTDAPQMIFGLFWKTYIYAAADNTTNNEANQALYGLLQLALKHECFIERDKISMMS